MPAPSGVRASTARRKEARGIAFRHVADVRFPYGHPRVGYVYARHPVDKSRYLLLADLHREILTGRTIEGARLLLALDARDVSTEWVSEQEAAATVAPRPTLPSSAKWWRRPDSSGGTMASTRSLSEARAGAGELCLI